jgi:hypothetical protein
MVVKPQAYEHAHILIQTELRMGKGRCLVARC